MRNWVSKEARLVRDGLGFADMGGVRYSASGCSPSAHPSLVKLVLVPVALGTRGWGRAGQRIPFNATVKAKMHLTVAMGDTHDMNHES